VILCLEELSSNPKIQWKRSFKKNKRRKEEQNNLVTRNEETLIEPQGEEHVEELTVTEDEVGALKNDEVDLSMSDETEVTSNTNNQSRYNLRPNRTPNYLRRFAFLSVQARIKNGVIEQEKRSEKN
jgi:hypothetical protein